MQLFQRKPRTPLDTTSFRVNSVYLYMVLVLSTLSPVFPNPSPALEQVSEVLRYKHYSLKTEQALPVLGAFFVRWHGRDKPMQHPRSMGGAEATQGLAMLANERRVSVSTRNQALSALLFLYREVLAVDLPWLTKVQRPTRPRRILSVLTSGSETRVSRAYDLILLASTKAHHAHYPAIEYHAPK